MLLPKLGGLWLFPPWDFPHQMRVTLWIKTAIHLDTQISILLKNPMNASTKLSMNGKSPMISTAPPFVLRLV